MNLLSLLLLACSGTDADPQFNLVPNAGGSANWSPEGDGSGGVEIWDAQPIVDCGSRSAETPSTRDDLALDALEHPAEAGVRGGRSCVSAV